MAMIHPRDVGAVAAVTLTEDGHEGRSYELTGPEAVTYQQVAEQLSAATGQQIQYVAVPDEAALQGMLDAGLPDWFATNLVAMAQFFRRGVGARVTDVVRVLTGREPRSVADFAPDHAAAFTASR